MFRSFYWLPKTGQRLNGTYFKSAYGAFYIFPINTKLLRLFVNFPPIHDLVDFTGCKANFI